MATGGSITATTCPTVPNTPSTSAPVSHSGSPHAAAPRRKAAPSAKNARCKSCDGTFAPRIVSHSTPNSIAASASQPPQPVRTRSARRCRASAALGCDCVTASASRAARVT